MPEPIIQTNTAPFARVTVDPITVELVEQVLRNVQAEMAAMVVRTALPAGSGEPRDAIAMIANQDGRLVVGQSGSFLHAIMQSHAATTRDGDIFLTNDPWSCQGAVSNLNEWLLMMPVFHQARLVSWAAIVGQMADGGGRVPASLHPDVAMTHDQGLIVPPCRITRAGALNEDLLGVLLANTRTPDRNRSTFFALVAALHHAERQTQQNAQRFGIEAYVSAMQALLNRNRLAMAAILKTILPEGPENARHFEHRVDDDGQGNGPFKLACTLWRDGDVAVMDFAGSDPQSPSPINVLLNEDMVKMALGACTITLDDPQILLNAGFFDLVDLRIPAGSILRPNRPAALSRRTHWPGLVLHLVAALLGRGAGFSDSPVSLPSALGQGGQDQHP